MTIQIYDSHHQEKRPLKTLEPNKVRLYVCGVTVYDFCHIGHARVYAFFDTLVRFLRQQGFEVDYVRNITDIDDKIIKRSSERGITPEALVEEYAQKMQEDFSALGIIPPTQEPMATHHIQEMIEMISRLIEKGCAYQADNGDVYYRVSAFESYGALSHQSIDALKEGARVASSTHKENPLDFVLWKGAKPGEPAWETPWGAGRPGWHIECSAMSASCLGAQIDIHGGGHDLLFPHHENERAQSEADSGKTFCQNWMHVGFVNINEEKMSKSLKNFFTIREVLESFPAEAVRYFLIASHYRSPINYTDVSLTSAHQSLSRLYGAIRGLALSNPLQGTDFEARFLEAMKDDFNTPVALSVLFDLANTIYKNPKQAPELGALLKSLAEPLGLLQSDPEKFFQSSANNAEVDNEWVEQKISDRQKAREDKNWSLADEIRDELEAKGIILEDASGKTTWRCR